MLPSPDIPAVLARRELGDPQRPIWIEVVRLWTRTAQRAAGCDQQRDVGIVERRTIGIVEALGREFERSQSRQWRHDARLVVEERAIAPSAQSKGPHPRGVRHTDEKVPVIELAWQAVFATSVRGLSPFN